MRIKGFHIGEDVADVLRRGSWDGEQIFVLPSGQLDRKLYEAVNKVLVAIGGKWNRSARGHVFGREARAALESALAAGHVVDQKKTLEQFFTPPDLARRMAAIGAEYTDRLDRFITVLEPSAGEGRLIEAFAENLDTSGNDLVFAVEIDPDLCEIIRQDGVATNVITADFMTINPLSISADLVLMNPPFADNKDIAHVLHAFEFLVPGGRLVAIMSPHFTFAADRPSREFRALIDYPEPGGTPVDVRYLCGGGERVEDCAVELLPAGTFKAEGTNIAAVLVTIDKGRGL